MRSFWKSLLAAAGLKEYPPRMQSLDFNIDETMRSLAPSGGPR